MILGCGCAILLKVLPSVGDVVYCRRHGFVVVPDRRTAKKRRKNATD